MSERLHLLLALGSTLGAYQIGRWCNQRLGQPALLHPLLLASILLATGLWLADVPFGYYRSLTGLFDQLLGLATVALAVPLHREFHHVKRYAGPVLVTVLLGSFAACGAALLAAFLAGGQPSLLLALAPKSVTTPIALGIAEQLHTPAGFTTGVVIFTGIVSAVAAPWVFRLCRLTDPRAQGLVLGLNGHGIGTARAFELHPTAGAFASLAMGFTGAFTALWLPALAEALGLLG
ncbi:LrgB family protein [Simiduia sp. 21SJ11W-1]|uniref:LrgB family protein n=1 Tax=Simiduia sp. 21SJ11W-1 TaxID=2909669 RepID=UPI0020A069E4|nr:LrgB family protein [Simiduia sp. 21SJ11W-1]UTA48029.1 LrgB family protein [Simiduia sp. 21SJ11W-1]